MKMFKYLHRHIEDKSEDFLSIEMDEMDQDIHGLVKYPKVRELHICGLTQKHFDTFIDHYAHQYDFIHFFKCPKIKDFSRMSELKNIKCVSIYWNNTATTLWDMKDNQSLNGIFINHFSKLTDLSCLSTAPNLQELGLTTSMDTKIKLKSLSPLKQINKLECLYFRRVETQSIRSLAQLSLNELTLSDNFYPVEDYAFLAANMPNTKCECFNGFIDESAYSPYDGEDIKIVGKRKPSLSSVENADRIQKYITDFNHLVEEFRRTKVEVNMSQL